MGIVRRAKLNVIPLRGQILPKIRKKRSRKFTGATWDEQEGRWCVKIQLPGQEKYLEYFDTEAEAVNAHNEALIRFGVRQ